MATVHDTTECCTPNLANGHSKLMKKLEILYDIDVVFLGPFISLVFPRVQGLSSSGTSRWSSRLSLQWPHGVGHQG